MKFFICALDIKKTAEESKRSSASSVGIPAGQTERIIPASQAKTLYETSVIISLPDLLKLNDSPAPHGIVFKSPGPVKTVLLTPQIEKELEVPDESIHGLPCALADLRRYFSGACFSPGIPEGSGEGRDMILILDLDKLMEGVL